MLIDMIVCPTELISVNQDSHTLSHTDYTKYYESLSQANPIEEEEEQTAYDGYVEEDEEEEEFETVVDIQEST